jgi:hypothetical protein
MSLFNRKPNQPKPRVIAGEEYFSMKDAAQLIGIHRVTLLTGLRTKYPFRFAKLGDSEKSPVFIFASDVRAYIRARDLAFQKQLQQNARA